MTIPADVAVIASARIPRKHRRESPTGTRPWLCIPSAVRHFRPKARGSLLFVPEKRKGGERKRGCQGGARRTTTRTVTSVDTPSVAAVTVPYRHDLVRHHPNEQKQERCRQEGPRSSATRSVRASRGTTSAPQGLVTTYAGSALSARRVPLRRDVPVEDGYIPGTPTQDVRGVCLRRPHRCTCALRQAHVRVRVLVPVRVACGEKPGERVREIG